MRHAGVAFKQLANSLPEKGAALCESGLLSRDC